MVRAVSSEQKMKGPPIALTPLTQPISRTRRPLISPTSPMRSKPSRSFSDSSTTIAPGSSRRARKSGRSRNSLATPMEPSPRRVPMIVQASEPPAVALLLSMPWRRCHRATWSKGRVQLAKAITLTSTRSNSGCRASRSAHASGIGCPRSTLRTAGWPTQTSTASPSLNVREA